MTIRSVVFGLFAFVLFLVASSPATGLANRVFVSARSGNNANACDDIRTPCQTFAGAVTQLNPKGEVIVLDSGGYGPVTITQAVTIEAPPGVTAFIHPPSGDAITINAGSSDVVTLRGLVLNTGAANGITINSVGTLNIESCSISGFAFRGILWVAAGRLNLKNVDVTDCLVGALIDPATGQGLVSVDHCHFDGNTQGYWASTDAPGATSTTIATNSTASNNSAFGWLCGGGSPGTDHLYLESCTGSDNGIDGLEMGSASLFSTTRYSNCVFAGNGQYGVEVFNGGSIESRGNNTIVGNSVNGTIGTFPPM